MIAVSPGHVTQSVGHLTRKSGVMGSIPGLATYFRFSFRFSRSAVVSYWRKYVHEVLVDRPDMTLDVYRGRKTTMQCNIAVSLNVGDGICLIKPAKLYMCTQTHYKHDTWRQVWVAMVPYR